MTPRFAQAVDPVFLYVLSLLERIERDESLSVTEERAKVRGYIDRAEAAVGQGQEWQLARYALVSWIDAMLYEAPWDGRDWWNDNCLEQELYGGRNFWDGFYIKAKEASALARRDALEVFYICVVLGFRGMYRDPVEAAKQAEYHDLPPDLEAWARQAAIGIQLGQGRPRITNASVMGEGAPPHDSQSALVSYLMVGAVLAALNIGMVIYLLR